MKTENFITPNRGLFKIYCLETHRGAPFGSGLHTYSLKIEGRIGSYCFALWLLDREL